MLASYRPYHIALPLLSYPLQVTTYQHLFADIDYVHTFKLLKERYDLTLIANGTNSNGNSSADQDRSNTGSGSGSANGDASAGPLAGRRITFQLGSEAVTAAPVAARGRGLLGVRRRRDDRALGKSSLALSGSEGVTRGTYHTHQQFPQQANHAI